MQADILNGCPDNGKATSLRSKYIDLIGALPNIAEETLDGIRGLNVSMQRGRKVIKRQEMLFIFHQASHGFTIAPRIFGFEGG